MSRNIQVVISAAKHSDVDATSLLARAVVHMQQAQNLQEAATRSGSEVLRQIAQAEREYAAKLLEDPTYKVTATQDERGSAKYFLTVIDRYVEQCLEAERDYRNHETLCTLLASVIESLDRTTEAVGRRNEANYDTAFIEMSLSFVDCTLIKLRRGY